MSDRTRREALRSFLMECRARLRPEDVGIASIGRRRVPGLRREEVAELVGISPAWYTLLESARDIRVSPRMLDRLADALRLSDQEKVHLFSLAIDELPAIPNATREAVAAGTIYSELRRFTRRTRSASSIEELADQSADLLFNLASRAEIAYFVQADLANRRFWVPGQRTGPHFELPRDRFDFSDVLDAEEVLVRGGLFAESNVVQVHHEMFGDRARELGGGRFISAGVKGPGVDGAIGYFQGGKEPFSEDERNTVGFIAEILDLALAAR
jgi:transcriptional regulator with XRE-family HTH domain